MSVIFKNSVIFTLFGEDMIVEIDEELQDISRIILAGLSGRKRKVPDDLKRYLGPNEARTYVNRAAFRRGFQIFPGGTYVGGLFQEGTYRLSRSGLDGELMFSGADLDEIATGRLRYTVPVSRSLTGIIPVNKKQRRELQGIVASLDKQEKDGTGKEKNEEFEILHLLKSNDLARWNFCSAPLTEEEIRDILEGKQREIQVVYDTLGTKAVNFPILTAAKLVLAGIYQDPGYVPLENTFPRRMSMDQKVEQAKALTKGVGTFETPLLHLRGGLLGEDTYLFRIATADESQYQVIFNTPEAELIAQGKIREVRCLYHSLDGFINS